MFIIQAGDCAEKFLDCTSEYVDSQVTCLKKLSQKLSEKIKKPVLTIGRIAGQYGKP